MDSYVSNYLTNFDIDPSGVGELVGQGTQHYIYGYQGNQVLKIPKNSVVTALFGGMQSTDIQRDIEILKQYMPGYMPETQVLHAPHGLYVVVQEVVKDARDLTYANFPLVKVDFVRIIEANQQIVRDHCLTLDLLGHTGYWHCLAAFVLRRKNLALIDNLKVVERQGRYTIKIVDPNLLAARIWCAGGVRMLRAIADSLYYQMVRILIRGDFGVEV